MFMFVEEYSEVCKQCREWNRKQNKTTQTVSSAWCIIYKNTFLRAQYCLKMCSTLFWGHNIAYKCLAYTCLYKEHTALYRYLLILLLISLLICPLHAVYMIVLISCTESAVCWKVTTNAPSSLPPPSFPSSPIPLGQVWLPICSPFLATGSWCIGAVYTLCWQSDEHPSGEIPGSWWCPHLFHPSPPPKSHSSYFLFYDPPPRHCAATGQIADIPHSGSMLLSPSFNWVDPFDTQGRVTSLLGIKYVMGHTVIYLFVWPQFVRVLVCSFLW